MKALDVTLIAIFGTLLALSQSVSAIKLAAIGVALILGALVVLWAFDPSSKRPRQKE